MSVTTKNLINLSSSKMQYFSFQEPLIYFIFDNSKLILSQKLIKCCKFFKILHLKMNKARLDELSVVYGSGNGYRYEDCYVTAGLSRVFLLDYNTKYFYKIETSMKTIKILNRFNYHSSRQSKFIQNYYLNDLTPKLDFCQTKKISLRAVFEVEREILEKIIQPALEELSLTCHSCKDVNPGLLVLQKCPNVKRISIYYIGFPKVPILTKNILKEMLKTKRENKIKSLWITCLSEIDPEDFIKLMDKHFAPNSFIMFFTNDVEFDALKQMFQKLGKIRPKNEFGIKIKLFNENGSRSSFTTFL